MSAQVRLATPRDARAIASLHARRISEGFLPRLGERFLVRLYRRVTRSPHAFAYVLDDGAPHGIVGFAAAATDVGALYREFARRDGVVAGVVAAPSLLRNGRRVIETLRYPARTGALPAAEVLAVAVDATSGGRGHGRRLVEAVTQELARRGVREAKVVAGSANEAALRLYRGCGFTRAAPVAVHDGAESEVLVWASR